MPRAAKGREIAMLLKPWVPAALYLLAVPLLVVYAVKKL